DTQVDGHDDLPGHAEVGRDPLGGGDFHRVPLAVAEGEGVDFVALGAGDGQRGGGIQAAAEQDDGAKVIVHPICLAATRSASAAERVWGRIPDPTRSAALALRV